jgi:hypothetical protein
MVIVSNIFYPPESAHDIAKRFLEAPQMPDFMTKRGPYFYSTLNDGIIGLAVYELDKSRVAEGVEFIGNYMATYFGVPGFKYEIRTFFEVEEGLKMIGMG